MNPFLFHWQLSLIHPLQISEQILPQGFVHPGMDMHSAVHLGILLEGNFFSEERLLEIFLTTPWQLHGKGASPDGAKLLVFTFLPEAVINSVIGEDKEFVRDLLYTPFNCIYPQFNTPEIKTACRELADSCQMLKSRYSAAVSERKSWFKLVDFLCDTARLINYDKEAEIGKKFQKIFPVFEQLASRQQLPLLPEQAAKCCCLSESYFHHLFKECMGISFSNYELCFRLSGASVDLAAGARIKEIASNWGFCDTSHFSNAFKRHFGVYPSHYRC
ncbi:MAG: helix-turn-helix domain-containing protein [Lentisphaeria bacterium]|nr:helix-turn-helix domain-containing protein [Lentisphaeria bacterium]